MCPKRNDAIGFLVTLAIGVAAALAAGEPAAEPPRAFSVEVAGEGPPMVLIPGLASSGEVWRSAVERYRDRYQVHVLTLAGFAGQAPVAPPLLATARDEIVRYLEAEGLERPVVVGHSLGGLLALWVAATAPDRVGAVVAVDGVPFLPALFDPQATVESVRPQAEQVRQMYATLTREQLALQTRMALATMIADPADVERATGWAAASDPATVGAAVAEAMTTDLRAVVAAVRAPVLLVGAGALAPDEAARERLRLAYEAQVERVPRHRVVFAPEARHFVMLDAPGLLYAAIDAFLAEPVPAAPAGAR
jgi:pimeloyl-ACP methyl ester carboxylesterase